MDRRVQNAVIQEKNRLICQAAEDKLAGDISLIPLDPQAGLADYFIIMSGHNANHTRAIAEEVDEKLSKAGMPPLRREGFREGDWILLDCGETIVHIFTAKQREYYGLEGLWKPSSHEEEEEIREEYSKE